MTENAAFQLSSASPPIGGRAYLVVSLQTPCVFEASFPSKGGGRRTKDRARQLLSNSGERVIPELRTEEGSTPVHSGSAASPQSLINSFDHSFPGKMDQCWEKTLNIA